MLFAIAGMDPIAQPSFRVHVYLAARLCAVLTSNFS